MSLSLKSVSLKLDNRQILKDVSLEINEGEIVSVIGPNGAGKSTLLNVLSGDISPDSGNTTYDNKQLNEISIQERAHKSIYIFKIVSCSAHKPTCTSIDNLCSANNSCNLAGTPRTSTRDKNWHCIVIRVVEFLPLEAIY